MAELASEGMLEGNTVFPVQEVSGVSPKGAKLDARRIDALR